MDFVETHALIQIWISRFCVHMYEQFQVVFTTLADAVFASIIRKISFLSMPT
jgi:hypothetical protein